MGLNTGVIFLNDALPELRDPQIAARFGEDLLSTINQTGELRMRGRVDIGLGGCSNGASMFHMDHADYVGVYALGGNYATRFGNLMHRGNRGHHEPQDQVALLRRVAMDLGYELVKRE